MSPEAIPPGTPSEDIPPELKAFTQKTLPAAHIIEGLIARVDGTQAALTSHAGSEPAVPTYDTEQGQALMLSFVAQPASLQGDLFAMMQAAAPRDRHRIVRKVLHTAALGHKRTQGNLVAQKHDRVDTRGLRAVLDGLCDADDTGNLAIVRGTIGGLIASNNDATVALGRYICKHATVETMTRLGYPDAGFCSAQRMAQYLKPVLGSLAFHENSKKRNWESYDQTLMFLLTAWLEQEDDATSLEGEYSREVLVHLGIIDKDSGAINGVRLIRFMKHTGELGDDILTTAQIDTDSYRDEHNAHYE